jgi:hypothetical protein
MAARKKYEPSDEQCPLGARVHVRCICGDTDCPAPASKGGERGTVVDREGELLTVTLEKPFQGNSTFEFPRSAVKRVNDDDE